MNPVRDREVQKVNSSGDTNSGSSVNVQTTISNHIISNGMKSEDLQKAPKLFCENIKIGFSPEFFVMGLSSGSQSHIFSLTPQHTKRLHAYLAHEIAQFEKVHGVIKAEWNPNVVSPVQKINQPNEMS